MNTILLWLTSISLRFRLRKRIRRIFLCGTFNIKYGDCFSVTYLISPVSLQVFLSGMNENKFQTRELRRWILNTISSKVIKTVQDNVEVGSYLRIRPSSI
jgi:hypothetical protein